MDVLWIMILAAGAFVLWFLPLPKDRARRISAQVGGAALFAIGVGGLVLQLMGPPAA